MLVQPIMHTWPCKRVSKNVGHIGNNLARKKHGYYHQDRLPVLQTGCVINNRGSGLNLHFMYNTSYDLLIVSNLPRVQWR